MIQRDQKIVNAKSMLGLLSLGADDQANMVLIAEGADEAEAAAAILNVLA
jgi:phosphotransferase system HPr (HPr) family protein